VYNQAKEPHDDAFVPDVVVLSRHVVPFFLTVACSHDDPDVPDQILDPGNSCFVARGCWLFE
jgi:hypothetical protein